MQASPGYLSPQSGDVESDPQFRPFRAIPAHLVGRIPPDVNINVRLRRLGGHYIDLQFDGVVDAQHWADNWFGDVEIIQLEGC